MSAPGAAGMPWKVVLAALVAGAAVGAVVTYGIVQAGGPPKPTQTYALSAPVHFQAGEGYPGYRLYVTVAAPEIPLAQVGMDIWRDGRAAGSVANLSACGGAVGSSPTADFVLYAEYADEIGCALSVGDWVAVTLYYHGLGHGYAMRLLDVGGAVLVNATFDVPSPPFVGFGTPATLADNTVVVPLANVTPPYAPERFRAEVAGPCGPSQVVVNGPLEFGVVAEPMCTTVGLEDRDGGGLLSAGDAFTFTRLGTATPGTYRITISWLDDGALATTIFP